MPFTATSTHTSAQSPSIRRIQHILYRAVDRHARTIAVAQHVAEAMVEAGVPRDRITVIPNGVDVPAESMLTARVDGPLRIGLLGRLDPQKGADVFVQAAKMLGRPAKLLLGAPVVSDQYGEEVVEAARAANVEVIIPADRGFLRSVDVVVMPSRYEGHPLVMLEAMALGKPVVASAIPGVQEAVEPDAALVVPPERRGGARGGDAAA